MPGEDSLLVSCGSGGRAVTISGSDKESTDPYSQSESCCWKCEHYDNTGLCDGGYHRICGCSACGTC